MGSIGASSKMGLLVKKKLPGGGLVKPGGGMVKLPGGEGNKLSEESSLPTSGSKDKATASESDTKDAKALEGSSKPAGPSGLGLLGAYSDSDNSSE